VHLTFEEDIKRLVYAEGEAQVRSAPRRKVYTQGGDKKPRILQGKKKCQKKVHE